MRSLRIGAALLSAAIVMSGCGALRGPIVDTGSKPEDVGGTIAGIVRVAGTNAPLSGRMVTVIDVATGARFDVSTAANGGYTLKVPRGRYRIEVELREGEELAERPADTEINTSDLDAARDFVVRLRAPAPSR